ncbi:AMP-binding protein [Nocardia sp. NPDC050713]|uniref:AMP-binding protein n=1 Tax=Nocardia sp. NPDC050713 TaxID=3154511 RepID=UPI0033E71D1E
MNATVALRTARDHLIALRDDYERAAAEFRWPDVGETFNWAHDWFEAFARGNESAGLVIVESDGSSATYTFDQLARTSDQVARWLADQGVAKGDAVIVMLGNRVELWQTMLAVMKLGAVIMPTTRAVGSIELADRIERGAARFVVCDAADRHKLAEVPGDCVIISTDDFADADRYAPNPLDHPLTGPRDPLLLYFTSGTTSKPKLVEHNQVSYPVGHLSTMYWLGLQPGDLHLNISSPGWAKHAWSSFFAPWLAEAAIVVYNYERFDAAEFLRVLADHRVTTMCAPPTVWRMIINADLSRGSGTLRELIGAGEPLNPEVIEHIRREWGLTIRDGFGQTETSAQVGNTRNARLKPGSMGRPLPGMPVLLVDPITGSPSDREGEICLDLTRRPLSLMTGYRGDEERNAEAMSGAYYHTGDIASVDADGYLTYIGRSDDVFKSSDYKISPFELESALIEHPAVLEAAVVPVPDPIRLAIPKAYVALAPGYTASEETAFEILRFARERLAPYQRVRRLEFLDLPKTISGKIRRVELREREQAGAARGNEYRDDQFPVLRNAKAPKRTGHLRPDVSGSRP